ncbi:DedA family protein [Candidatus Bandiella numerosa]|uniref:DedA family protein n=1 Tax=Candidatus Bandiella numerosa TaxID=2570586 RepID=UPI001F2A5862|nr:DedA family protein [Candidatus Bandiella numerosa]
MFVEFFGEVFKLILNFVQIFGYIGIFIMTFIESTFIPVPSELTLIPAGFLIAKGELHLAPVLISSLAGTLLGSLLNYFMAYHFGRKLFINYGKYFFLKSDQLLSLELFFNKYGAISTFFGRMLPGIKHFISFPAGLARMDLKLFVLYTILGSFIWLSFILYLGHIISTNEELISIYIKRFNIVIIFVVIFIAILLYAKGNFKNKNK